MIAQSLIVSKSTHIYNGAFGQKWFDYTNRLKKNSENLTFSVNETLKTTGLVFPESDVICVTQNETSNGTQLTNDIITKIKEQNPHAILAIDATSSMGGIILNYASADIWFASVQKCFGLPAGLAVMICSPKAIEKIKSIGERDHYNSLDFVNSMMEKWQTPFTPNVLTIYLLMRVMKDQASIKVIHKKIVTRQKKWTKFFSKHKSLNLLPTVASTQSHTVLTITGDTGLLSKIKKDAKCTNILLGEGYGELKATTFRIANFPAIKKKEIERLMAFLRQY
jgi:phosphoserine aminotransferase